MAEILNMKNIKVYPQKTLNEKCICVELQNPLQGYDGHFTPQAQRLKVETTQTSYCN